jgi:prepilin-type N-terminal cleavage/methylation domain-containing protein
MRLFFCKRGSTAPCGRGSGTRPTLHIADRRRGFTLVELLISITLVAALSAGMLMAMRAGLLTLQKVDDRLQSNRRVISVQQIISREISNAMPVLGTCGPAFIGNAQTLRLVSSYSMTEGARGYPRVIEMQVLPADRGVRLIVNEALYTGPDSMTPFCQNGQLAPGRPTPQSFVLADRLASCQFVYKSTDPNSPRGGNWVPQWTAPNLPYAVRVEMTPLVADPARLPLLTVTARIAVTRDVLIAYPDDWQ